MSFFKHLKDRLSLRTRSELDQRVLHSVSEEFDRAIRLAEAGSVSKRPLFWRRAIPAALALGLVSWFWLKQNQNPTLEQIAALDVDPVAMEALEVTAQIEEWNREGGLDLWTATDEEWAILLEDEQP